VWSASQPDHFTQTKRASSTHWIGGWVGTRADMDMAIKRKDPFHDPAGNQTPL